MHNPFFPSVLNAAFLLRGFFFLSSTSAIIAHTARRGGALPGFDGTETDIGTLFWERNRQRFRTETAKCLVAPLAVKTDMGSLKTSTFTEYRRPGRPLKKNAERCGCKLSIEPTGMKTPSRMRESAALISYQARECPVFIKLILSLLKVNGQNHIFHFV